MKSVMGGGVAAAVFGMLVFLISNSAVAFTQGVCIPSPENPTVILGLLSAAAGGYPILRARIRQWRDQRDSDSAN